MIYKVTFAWIKEVCRFRKDGFEDDVVKDTCRNKYNTPKGCSWGECSEETCPWLKIERRID